MKIEKIATQYETIYIANDNTQWNTETMCQQYEELLADPSPLKALKFFNQEGEPINIFECQEIPCFAYLVLTESLPKQYHWKVVAKIIGDSTPSACSYTLPNKEGIWYNDWSNAYNGGFGFNGWTQCETINTLLNTIQNCQNKIKFLEKITNTP